jgi:aminopeptidase N
VAPYVERYLRDAPAWAARGQALAGHLPTVLRRQWEDWRDDLG